MTFDVLSVQTTLILVLHLALNLALIPTPSYALGLMMSRNMYSLGSLFDERIYLCLLDLASPLVLHMQIKTMMMSFGIF